jgi:hypothetical protein
MEQRGARIMWNPQKFCGNYPKKGLLFRMILNWRGILGFSTVETPQNVEHFVEAKSYIFQCFKSIKYTFHIFHSDLEKFSEFIYYILLYLIKWKKFHKRG